MAFVVTDIELVVALGVILVVVYVAGTYWKHKELTRYAHWFEEKFSGNGKVKFASHGHAGLRIKCEIKKSSLDGLREMQFAISLGARENLMYYALSHFMHDFDRLNCWGLLSKPVRSNIKVLKISDKRRVAGFENSVSLKKIGLEELSEVGYVAFTSDTEYATNFISRASLPSKLKEMKGVELMELDTDSSMLHVVARLKKSTLPQLMNFILSLSSAV
jgi:hypothetical protein